MLYYILFAVVAYIVIQIFVEQLLIKKYDFCEKCFGEYNESDVRYFSWGWLILLPLLFVTTMVSNSYCLLKRYLLKESDK